MSVAADFAESSDRSVVDRRQNEVANEKMASVNARQTIAGQLAVRELRLGVACSAAAVVAKLVGIAATQLFFLAKMRSVTRGMMFAKFFVVFRSYSFASFKN